MASRKSKRKSLIQVIILSIAVLIVVIVSLLFQNWWTSHDDPEPQDVSISAKSSASSTEVHPFSICEPGVKCAENLVTQVNVAADDELRLEIPREIHDHDWVLLAIYDDPAANQETYYKPNETTEVTVLGSVAPVEEGGARPELVVVEVSTILVGHNDAGEETPYTVTWSLATRDL